MTHYLSFKPRTLKKLRCPEKSALGWILSEKYHLLKRHSCLRKAGEVAYTIPQRCRYPETRRHGVFPAILEVLDSAPACRRRENEGKESRQRWAELKNLCLPEIIRAFLCVASRDGTLLAYDTPP